MWTRSNILVQCRNCSEAFPVWTEALSAIQFATLPFDLNPLTRFHGNFCSDKSVQTWFGPFQKPIRYGTFHFQQRSGAVLFRNRKCFESSVSSVNRSPIRYTFCDAPFHCPVQYEHSLKWHRKWFTYRRNFGEICESTRFASKQEKYEISYYLLISCNNRTKLCRQKVPEKNNSTHKTFVVKVTVSVPDPFHRFYNMLFIYPYGWNIPTIWMRTHCT